MAGGADTLHASEGLEIPLAEVTIRTSRSSGPGGQHANVTASRVEASIALDECRALSDSQRERLRERYGDRVAAVSQDARSQARNRELALTRLARRIAAGLHEDPPRRPTRPTAASRERRRREKELGARRKRSRRPPEAGD